MLGKCDGEVEEEEKGARARAGEKVARYASSEHKSGVAHGPAGCTLRPRRDQAVCEAMRRRIRICTHTSVESALSSAAAAAAKAAASGARREGEEGKGGFGVSVRSNRMMAMAVAARKRQAKWRRRRRGKVTSTRKRKGAGAADVIYRMFKQRRPSEDHSTITARRRRGIH